MTPTYLIHSMGRTPTHGMCGPWEPRLYVYCTPSWSQVDWLPCASMVSGAVTMPVGMASDSEKSVTFEVFPAGEIVLLEVPPIFSVPPDP